MSLFRVEISGVSPSAGEVWSVGLNWGGPITNLTQEELMQWATNIGVAINAMAANPLIQLLSDAGTITKIRTEQRAENDEHLIRAAEYSLPTPKAGAGTISKPLQTALVISLLTNIPGRSYRGRAYWPAWAYSGTAGGLFGGSNLTSWVGGFKTIANAITAAAVAVDPALNMILVVRSRLLHTHEPVITLGAGNVPDTQRRRRDAIAELYTTLAM